jgi:hypothetical protein
VLGSGIAPASHASLPGVKQRRHDELTGVVAIVSQEAIMADAATKLPIKSEIREAGPWR